MRQQTLASQLSFEKSERRPVGLAIMLPTYFMQQWFDLSDLGVEEAFYESATLRCFAGVDPSPPDARSPPPAADPIDRAFQANGRIAGWSSRPVTKRPRNGGAERSRHWQMGWTSRFRASRR